MRSRQAAFQIRHLLPPGLVLWLILAACSPKTLPPTPLPATLTPRASSTATISTPTPLPTKTPTITPTPACTSSLGQLQQVELTSERMYQPFKMTVYLPPCYAFYPERDYPVLFLFHGIYYSNDQWERLGVTQIADRLISSGEFPPFIIVMPYDPNGREPAGTVFDEVFLEQGLPYVDENFRTLPDARHRAVGGLSRGGGWAFHFGLTHPDLFGAIGAHSPVIFWEDGSEIGKWLDAIPRIQMPRMYLDIGDRDPDHDSIDLLKRLLQDRNLPFEVYLNSGYHTEQYWSLHVEDYIRWYAGGW